MTSQPVTPADGPRIRETFEAAPLAVRALLVGTAISKIGAFVQIFLVLFLVSQGFSDGRAGLALGFYGVGSIAGVLAGGWISDRVGPRLTIVVGMVANAAFSIAVLYVTSFGAVLVAVTLLGAASQCHRPAAATLLGDMTPKDRLVMVFAMSRFALNVGATVAPLIGAALVALSYSALFWGEAIASVAYAVIAVFVLPADSRARVATEQSDEADQADEADEPGRPDEEDEPPVSAGGYLAVAKDRRYVLYLVAVVVNALVYQQSISTLPLAMSDLGLATVWYGAMMAVNGFIVITCELLMTRVVQRWALRRVLTVGFILLGAGFAAYALPGGLAVFFLGTVLWSLAEIIQGPSMFTYPVQAGPRRLTARYVAAMEATFGIGSAAGPVLGIALFIWLGSSFWLLCGMASVLALIPAWAGVRTHASAR